MTGTPFPAAAPARANLPEYTVSELSAALRRTIEQGFSYVRVRGEISGWKRHGSGHCYLALKDAEAVIDAVCWRTTALRLPLKPEDGMEVVCTGRLTTYPGRSKYQLVIESMELAGVGALLKILEERRKRLAAEGLFAAERKKKLPFLPKVIGVITSPSGAVIRDILHRLNDRFPRHVLLWPVAVQGEGAAEQVVGAIQGFNRLAPGGRVPRPDLLIVARGGGSLEDLMAFNEESVVRAAAASAIPLISAVGHETDTTLIDHASDKRAPTPSAAAEMAVPVRLDLVAELEAKALRLTRGWSRALTERRTRVEGLARGLPQPRSLLDGARQKLDDRAERLINGFRQAIALRRHRLDGAGQRLNRAALEAQLDRARQRLGEAEPRLQHAMHRFFERQQHRLDNASGRLETYRRALEEVLEKGFAIVRDARGMVVESTLGIAQGDQLSIEFHDGRIGVVVGGDAPQRPTSARAKKAPAPGQGSLL
jgi:exodeoxyribonuclease VII large subunit